MTGFWTANLGLLGRRTDPGSRALAEALAGGPADDLGLRDRQGRTAAGWTTGGRPRALSSAYGPEAEAQRWAEGWTGGTAVVFGAAGPAAAAALEARGLKLAFWVEPRLELWRSQLTWEDWTPWLARDDWYPVWGPADRWVRLLKDRYHPLWDGGLRTFDWRSATPAGDDPWVAYREGTRRALDEVASDASTQARFGERWYRNTLRNLERLEPARFGRCPGARVVVAGAGPGLEDELNREENLRWLENRNRTGGRLFATDTAFPALAARNIAPDLILSLDGQLPTYHHFASPILPHVPLAADLAALPLLGRLGRPVIRYLSGHPFGAVVRRHFPDLPVLDGSLGNVSGLAWRTALALGASEVSSWGVDFAYRDGQAYARGTYVYDLAARRAGRLGPMETRLGLSCYAAAGRERHRDALGRAWDTTPLLRHYRILQEAPAPRPTEADLGHDGSAGRWASFAADWAGRLDRLPFPPAGMPFHPFVRRLEPDTRRDWLALWPLALSLHRTGVPEAEAARAARDRARELLADPGC